MGELRLPYSTVSSVSLHGNDEFVLPHTVNLISRLLNWKSWHGIKEPARLF